MSFPELPYDIVECILIHAASSGSSATLTLCQVAAWVRTIAVRELFHTVVLDSYPKHIAFLGRLAGPGTATPPAIPLGHHVRHVLVHSNGADMYAMYQLCPFLETLAIPASRLVGFSTSAPRVFPKLRSLTVLTAGPSSITDALWTNPARVLPYTTLTHLRFCALPVNPLPLERMPQLTHLALPLAGLDTPPEEHDALVQRCPALLMLVLTTEPGVPCAALASVFSVHNTRMYVCPYPEDPVAEWRREIDSGPDIWERAAQFRNSQS
ncbi:hypothetical protein DFH07DRAFT_862667 [Mycena maculata]|uniref:F-box domain-containing protein n=1 Tax=Mycena maculata TaxID=230809 RepID=A0AAD7HAH9_9AGAR|nr:hypothetical protein DFH07DRAFT_862667 [Mycena maculata]